MEEQRQRQEDEARRTAVASAAETGLPASAAADGEKNVHSDHFYTKDFSWYVIGMLTWIFFCLCLVAESEHALLKMSAPHTDSSTPALPDFNRMTEEEQIAYALQMSMQGAGAGETLYNLSMMTYLMNVLKCKYNCCSFIAVIFYIHVKTYRSGK